MDYFLQALKNFAVFSGRARRKEYWMFALFNIIFSFVAMAADYVMGASLGGTSYGFVYMLYSLAMLIPALAVGVRRLHDVNKSGWFTLIVFIPLVGGIWLLVLACTEGTHGDNQYGADPKGEALAF